MSSHERKYASFLLVEFVLPALSVDEVGVVFSPNLLRCLLNNSHSTTTYLYPTARHLVCCCASSGSTLSIVFLLQLNKMSACVEAIDEQAVLIALLIHLQRRYSNGGQLSQLDWLLYVFRTNGKFDSLTGSKVVDVIVSKINVDGVNRLLSAFQEMLTGQTTLDGSR